MTLGITLLQVGLIRADEFASQVGSSTEIELQEVVVTPCDQLVVEGDVWLDGQGKALELCPDGLPALVLKDDSELTLQNIDLKGLSLEAVSIPASSKLRLSNNTRLLLSSDETTLDTRVVVCDEGLQVIGEDAQIPVRLRLVLQGDSDKSLWQKVISKGVSVEFVMASDDEALATDSVREVSSPPRTAFHIYEARYHKPVVTPSQSPKRPVTALSGNSSTVVVGRGRGRGRIARVQSSERRSW